MLTLGFTVPWIFLVSNKGNTGFCGEIWSVLNMLKEPRDLDKYKSSEWLPEQIAIC